MRKSETETATKIEKDRDGESNLKTMAKIIVSDGNVVVVEGDLEIANWFPEQITDEDKNGVRKREREKNKPER